MSGDVHLYQTNYSLAWLMSISPTMKLSRLQAYLNDNAEAGDIIRASGGVRKLRWAAARAREAWWT